MKWILGLILGMMFAAGCATVQPWEKERLGQADMEFRGGHKTRHFVNHAAITVEEAEGGDGTAGGGCGCR